MLVGLSKRTPAMSILSIAPNMNWSTAGALILFFLMSPPALHWIKWPALCQFPVMSVGGDFDMLFTQKIVLDADFIKRYSDSVTNDFDVIMKDSVRIKKYHLCGQLDGLHVTDIAQLALAMFEYCPCRPCSNCIMHRQSPLHLN